MRTTGLSAARALELWEAGATDLELAIAFKIVRMAIQNWRAHFPALTQAGASGKDTLDDRVERTLYERAVGHGFESVKITQDKGRPAIV